MRIATEKQYGITGEDSIDFIAEDVTRTLHALRGVNADKGQTIKIMLDIETA